MSLNATDAGSRASPPATPNPLDEEDQADVNQECWSPGQRRRPEDMSPFERLLCLVAAPVEGGENPEDLIDSPSEREKTPLPPRSMKGNVKYGSAAEMEAEAMNRVLLERAFETADVDGDGTLTLGEVELFLGLLDSVGGTPSKRRKNSLRSFHQSGDEDGITKETFVERGMVLFQREKAVNLRKQNSSVQAFKRKLSSPKAGIDESGVVKSSKTAKLLQELIRIKTLFDSCDTDKGGDLDAEEIQAVMIRMNQPCRLQDAEKAIKFLDADDSGTIDWVEFAQALGAGRFEELPYEPGGPKWSKFNLENLAALPSDFDAGIQVTESEYKAMLNNMNIFERTGVQWLANAEKSRKKAFKTSARKHSQRLESDQKDKMTAIIWIALFAMAVIGTLGAFFSIWTTDAVSATGYYQDSLELRQQAIDATVSGFFYAIELCLVYLTCISLAIRVSAAAGLRLWPLNPDRGIVAASLTRASLSLGHPSVTFHGVKPPVGRKITYLLHTIGIVIYFFKRIGLKWVVRTVLRGAGVDVGDGCCAGIWYIDAPVNMFWHLVLVRKSVNNSKVCVLGPPCVIDLFRDVIANEDFSEEVELVDSTKIQVIRAIAAMVKCKKQFHPNLYLFALYTQKLALANVDLDSDSLYLNDLERFETTLIKDTREGQLATLRVMLVCCLLDGQLHFQDEQKLIAKMCGLVEGTSLNWRRVKRVLFDFKKGNGVSLSDLDECLGLRVVMSSQEINAKHHAYEGFDYFMDFLDDPLTGVRDAHLITQATVETSVNVTLATADLSKNVVLDTHAVTKKVVLDTHAVTKKVVTDTHAVTKKAVLDTRAVTKKAVADTHAVTKKAVLDTHAVTKKAVVDTHAATTDLTKRGVRKVSKRSSAAVTKLGGVARRGSWGGAAQDEEEGGAAAETKGDVNNV